MGKKMERLQPKESKGFIGSQGVDFKKYVIFYSYNISPKDWELAPQLNKYPWGHNKGPTVMN